MHQMAAHNVDIISRRPWTPKYHFSVDVLWIMIITLCDGNRNIFVINWLFTVGLNNYFSMHLTACHYYEWLADYLASFEYLPSPPLPSPPLPSPPLPSPSPPLPSPPVPSPPVPSPPVPSRPVPSPPSRHSPPIPLTFSCQCIFHNLGPSQFMQRKL